jgi:glycosyltransferase involved in cell wall biosynthesis
VKICFVDHESKLGGAEKSLVDICRYLPKDKYEILVVIQGEGELAEALRKAGIKQIHFLPMDGWRWWSGGWLNRLRLLLSLEVQKRITQQWLSFFQKEKPDIIHFNLARLVEPVQAAQKSGIPSILHYRENTEGQKRFFGGLPALFKLLHKCDYWVANSYHTRKEMIPYAGGKTIRVIRNAIELPVYPDRIGRTAFPEDQFVLVNVASLVPWKNHVMLFELMLEIVKHCPNAHLYCYGKGTKEWEVHLQTKIQKCGLENNVTFCGFAENIQEILPQADCMVHCSGRESFGRIYIEGMWAGLPVFALEGDAASEIIQHGEDGFIFSGGRLPETAAEIIEIVRSKEKTNIIALNARKKVKEEFGMERLIRELCALYEQIAEYNSVNTIK